MFKKIAILASTAFLLSCNQDETAFGPQNLKAFESGMSGRVTDRQGRALSGAMVTVLPSGTTTVTSRDGLFTLSGLAEGNYRISVIKDDYRDTMWLDSVRLGLSVVRDLGSLGMRYRYATIAGVVQDSTGVAIPSAGIVVEDQTSSAMAVSEGKFLLGRVAPGRVRLFSAIQGVGYGTIDTTIDSDDTLRGVKIRINRRGGTVTGQIVDENDNALTGANVLAVGGALKTSSDNGGDFRIGEIPSEGNVVFVISKGDRSAVVSGVRVKEGGSTDLLKITIPVFPTSGPASIYSGIAIAYTTDLVVNLVATSVVKDTSFKVLRHLWSTNGGSSWDTTSSNVWGLDIAKAKWGTGTHEVRVKLLALDGRVSDEAKISVRLIPPPDWTAPSVQKVTLGTTYASSVDSAIVKWIVRDSGALDSVKIQQKPAKMSGDTAWLMVSLGVGSNTIRLWTRDKAGNVAQDSMVLTRQSSTDTTIPKIARVGLVGDTLKLQWTDSTAFLRWTVKDGNLKSVWVDTSLETPRKDTVMVFRNLAAGSTIKVVIRALDSANNELSDTIVVSRMPKPSASLKLAKLHLENDSLTPRFHPDSANYSVTVAGALPHVMVEAVAADTTQSVVWIDGTNTTLKSVRLDSTGAATTIRVVVFGNGGRDSLEYKVEVFRKKMDTASFAVKMTRDSATTLWPRDTIRVVPVDTTDVIEYSIDGGALAAFPKAGLVLTKACSLSIVSSATGKINATWNKRFDFTTWNPNTTYDSVTHGGQSYRTVKIGGKWWMAENLNIQVDSSWQYGTADSDTKYGRLYTWAALMGLPASCNSVSCSTMVKPIHQGLCPNGWHVPNAGDWSALLDSAGGVANAGSKLKATFGWNGSGNGADDAGFRALPGGGRTSNGNFVDVRDSAYWWSATVTGSAGATYAKLSMRTPGASMPDGFKSNAHAARCVEGAATRDTSILLKSLAVDSGKLSRFDSTTFALVDTVTTSVKILKLNAKAVSDSAKITYNDSASSTIDITSLDSIKVMVTNYGKFSTYTIRIHRIPNPVTDSTYGIAFSQSSTYGVLKDSRDGEEYRTLVMKDGKTWMAENLNHQVENSWAYDNDIDTSAKYGRLYTWASALGLDDSCNFSSCSTQVQPATHQGVCPADWHVPSMTEWYALMDSVGGVDGAGTTLKSVGGWDAQGNGVDELGFRILPAGNRSGTGAYAEIKNGTGLWSTSESAVGDAFYLGLASSDQGAREKNAPRASGLSLRCVHN